MSKPLIRCPHCNGYESVIKMVHFHNGLPIENDRFCLNCGETFKTVIKFQMSEENALSGGKT